MLGIQLIQNLGAWFKFYLDDQSQLLVVVAGIVLIIVILCITIKKIKKKKQEELERKKLNEWLWNSGKMFQKVCPYCRTWHDENALVCPGCGRPDSVKQRELDKW